MQTELHIAALVAQMRSELIGGTINSTAFYKKERAVYFHIRNERNRHTLGFVYHPRGFGTYLVKSSRVRITTKEKPWPLFVLDNAVITNIKQVIFDRIIRINITHDDKKFTILIEALGPNGNIWLLEENNTRIGTLRKRSYKKDEKYESPPIPDKLSPFTLEGASLLGKLSENPLIPMSLSKNILGINKTLSAEIISRAGLSGSESISLDNERAEKLIDTIHKIAGQFDESQAGYLYRMPGIEVYPFKLITVDKQPEKFNTLSLAVLAMVESRQQAGEQLDEEKRVVGAISRAIRKMSKRIGHVKKDIVEAADFEEYRVVGELLRINHKDLKRGMSSITVENILGEPVVLKEIKLDSALSPNDNAERYFRKHRKGREGLELLERRLEISESELEQLELIFSALETNFDSGLAKYSAEIASVLPRESERREAFQRLPYREHKLSTGLTIFVGREGADNDRTTFEFTKPYELWFHTQQCPGSHVVIKYPNKSFEPSKREIEETAAIAAWHSKARKNSLVPVIYTHRRYVRKPRKSKAGLVTVEREKSVMIAPRKPE